MDCRTFVTDNLHAIVEILLYKSQLGLNTTTKDDLGLSESDYAQKAIRLALQLINADVKKNEHKFTIHCESLHVLALILNCRDTEASMEMRMDKILAFQRNKGFYHLAVYINARCGTKAFPYWELVHHVLDAILDGILHLQNLEDEVELLAEFRKAAMNTIVGVMKHMSSLDAKALLEIDASMIANIISSLSALSEDLATCNCKALSSYSTFCQDGIIKLQSSSSSGNHKMLGTELLQNLIQTILGTRPLAKSLLVKGAGLGLGACNGIYTISSTCLDRDGFVIPGLYPRYERHVSESNEKFILFLRMDPTSKDYWVLSEAQEEDRLIDVYANVPECICYIPPSLGWVCLDKYNNPAPTLKPLDEMVPIRDEHLALKHDLAKWFVENIAVQINGSSSPSDSVSINKLVGAIDASQEDITPDKIAALVLTIKPESSTPPPPLARQMSLESKDETPVVSRVMSSESVVSRVMSSESVVSRVMSSESTPSAIETSPSAIDAAKLSVASSERWLEATQKMLATAQQEHDAAYEMVSRAREYLAALEKKEGMKRKDGEKDARRSAQRRSSRVQKKGEKNEMRSSMKNFSTRIFRTHS
jgi:hypothetical protein